MSEPRACDWCGDSDRRSRVTEPDGRWWHMDPCRALYLARELDNCRAALAAAKLAYGKLFTENAANLGERDAAVARADEAERAVLAVSDWWSENWDCSASPGHEGFPDSIAPLVARIRERAEAPK